MGQKQMQVSVKPELKLYQIEPQCALDFRSYGLVYFKTYKVCSSKVDLADLSNLKATSHTTHLITTIISHKQQHALIIYLLFLYCIEKFSKESRTLNHSRTRPCLMILFF